MALKVNTDEWIEKGGRRLKSSQTDILRGVNSVTEAPGIRAAQQVDAMRAGILESLDNGTWQRAVAGVSLGEWQDAMINKGIPRLAVGVDQAAGKIRDKIGQLLQEVETAQTAVDRMPKGTFQDSLNRMTQFSTLMHASKLNR